MDREMLTHYLLNRVVFPNAHLLPPPPPPPPKVSRVVNSRSQTNKVSQTRDHRPTRCSKLEIIDWFSIEAKTFL